MARPKSGSPRKKSLNLTISEKARGLLDKISAYRQKSISALVEEWALKEAKKYNLEE